MAGKSQRSSRRVVESALICMALFVARELINFSISSRSATMENGMTGIPCAPEEVITNCLSMIDQLEPCLKNANFSGDLRKEVWEREIQE